MPLIRRTVLPTNLCLTPLPENGINELEMVTNNTLSGVISQLSDLSRHAEDVFGELTNEAHQFNDRCRVLGERIVNLNDRISLMSQNSSEHMEPYALRSREIKYDDQVVSRDTLPKALQATYYEADPPPPLQMLQKYRDDNKDPLKIYTNPDYFFELWRENLQKEMEKARQERKDKKRRAKEKEKLTKLNRENQRKPVNEIAPVKRHQDQWKAKGAEFEADAKQKYAQQLQSQNTNKMRDMNISQHSQHQQHHKPSRPKSKYPPDEYPPPTDSGNSTMNSTVSHTLPPPSFPQDQHAFPPPIQSPDFPPPFQDMSKQTSGLPPGPPPGGPPGAGPPPPPPPLPQGGVLPPPTGGPPPSGVPPPPGPMPNMMPPPPGPSKGPGLPPPQDGRADLLRQIQNPNLTLKKAQTKPVVKDARTNLLDEIAKGKQLKKTVINQNKTPTNQIAGNSMIDSVQQMLEQRRAAIDSDSDDSDDSDAWDD